MRKQLDIFKDDPARQAEAARVAAEIARIDPHYSGVVRDDRVAHYLAEAERLDRLAAMAHRPINN